MKTNTRWKALWRAGLVLGVAASLPAMVENDGYTRQQTNVAPDSEAGGWFINLGITGARGRMSPKSPKEIEVAYIFNRTPAKGVLEIGDRIVGANGRRFATPHKFGYAPICMITAQAMAAWSLMMSCGIEVDEERYMMAHEFLAQGTNNIGYVWYADGGGRDDAYADMGRTGASVVAHGVSPLGGAAFQRYTRTSARCIGDHPKTFPDTHGSPILGMGWTALGAAFDDKALRQLMDEHVWHFTLAHCPDGTFYYQPNRDNNAQDFSAAPRLSASAVAALVLSIRNRSLRVMGTATEPPSPAQPVSRLPEPPEGELRTFQNADHSKSFEARLVAFDRKTGLLRVRLRNGTTLDLDFGMLSREDQDYLREQSAGKE